MGNKQEPAKSLQFHHGARHCVNVQSELSEKSFSIRLVFTAEYKMASKAKGQIVSVVSLLIGILKCWQL